MERGKGEEEGMEGEGVKDKGGGGHRLIVFIVILTLLYNMPCHYSLNMMMRYLKMYVHKDNWLELHFKDVYTCVIVLILNRERVGVKLK